LANPVLLCPILLIPVTFFLRVWKAGKERQAIHGFLSLTKCDNLQMAGSGLWLQQFTYF